MFKKDGKYENNNNMVMKWKETIDYSFDDFLYTSFFCGGRWKLGEEKLGSPSDNVSWDSYLLGTVPYGVFILKLPFLNTMPQLTTW